MDNKFTELFKTYDCDSLTDEQVKNEVAKILSAHFAENNNEAVYRECFSCIDLTSLKETDNEAGIMKMVEKVKRVPVQDRETTRTYNTEPNCSFQPKPFKRKNF